MPEIDNLQLCQMMERMLSPRGARRPVDAAGWGHNHSDPYHTDEHSIPTAFFDEAHWVVRAQSARAPLEHYLLNVSRRYGATVGQPESLAELNTLREELRTLRGQVAALTAVVRNREEIEPREYESVLTWARKVATEIYGDKVSVTARAEWDPDASKPTVVFAIAVPASMTSRSLAFVRRFAQGSIVTAGGIAPVIDWEYSGD